jgi:ABC-type glycerol-3-phosphate transport system permease component
MSSNTSSQHMTPSQIIQRVVLYLGVIVFVTVALLPFYWLVLSSLTPQTQLFSIPPNYFPDITGANFVQLVTQLPFLAYLTNSILFSAASVLISVAISFLAAYGFARYAVPGSNILMLGLVLSMALPPIVTVIPLFDSLRLLGMVDTILGISLIMGSVLVPFSVWVLVSFVKRIPAEMEEAAYLDGAKLVQIFAYVVIPVMTPALATVIVINLINAWNNLLFPLVFTSTTAAKTLTVSITEVFQARTPYGRPWGIISAIGVTMVVPMAALLLFAQKWIVSGLTKGSTK